MKRNRKSEVAGKGKKSQPPKTSRDTKTKATDAKLSTLPKLGSSKHQDDGSTGEHVLNARVESGNISLPEVTGARNKRNDDSTPEQKPYVYNSTKPVQLRLRTPSPERRRRHLEQMDKADNASKSTLHNVMDDLNELRNTRAKMEERAILKYQNRFTELPTPVWNPPPKGMPRNNEIIQRVLDRRDIGQAGVLHPESRNLPFDMNLLRMAYDAQPEVSSLHFLFFPFFNFTFPILEF
jgi:membrane-bound lytic murein transglycosylase